MWEEFKKFVLRGNVVDLAVAVVIGGAFGAITTSLVQDVLTPPIGLITGGVDFSNVGIVLQGEYADTAAAIAAGAPVIKIGNFINAIINFLMIAIAMFAVVKAANKAQSLAEKKEEAAAAAEPPAPPEDVVLLREIRDLLKKQA